MGKTAVSSSSPLKNVSQPLVFNEGEGEKVSDASNFGNQGEIHNAEWVEGEFGEALGFNGANSYVLVPNSPELNMTTQFTAEAWVNPYQLSLSMIFQKKRIGGGDGEMEYSIMANGVGTAYGDGLSANIQATNINFGANLELNEWQHVAMVYDSGTATTYINGEVVGEAAAPGEIKIKDGDLVIGLHVMVNATPETGAHCHFNGIVDGLADRILAHRPWWQEEPWV